MRIRQRGRWLGLLVGLGAAVTACGPAAAQKKTAQFDVTAVHSAPGGEVTITSKVYITPTQARADVKHPIEGEQSVIVAGGFFYQLDPKSKRGLKTPLPPQMKQSPDNFNLLVSKFAFDASGPLKMSKKVRTETVSGYLCDVFTNTLTQGNNTRTITTWVPQKMQPNFPIKTVVVDKEKVNKPGLKLDQSSTVTITLSNIKTNTALSPSLFKLPTGYKFITPPAAKPAAKKK